MILLRIPKFIGRKLYWRNPRETHVTCKSFLKYYYVIGKKIDNFELVLGERQNSNERR